jgi:hypothetical protein
LGLQSQARSWHRCAPQFRALGPRGIEQARIPGERHGDGAAVGEVDDQPLSVEEHVRGRSSD